MPGVPVARGRCCVIVDSDHASRTSASLAAVAFTGGMREHRATTSGPAPWPGVPHAGSAPAWGQARSHSTAIAEITVAIGSTRWLFLISGGLLAADIAGAVAVAAALLGHPGAVTVATVGLLMPVALSWLVAAALLLRAQQPVTDALGEPPLGDRSAGRPVRAMPAAGRAATVGLGYGLVARRTAYRGSRRPAGADAPRTIRGDPHDRRDPCRMVLSLTIAAII